MNYYNDNDPKKAAWLRQNIAEGLIPQGDVDTRSIEEVHPSDLLGYTQHHFFAGIGGWSFALSLAGWPEDRPVCTASLPCQPFSQTGLRLAFHDSRHLWPVFFSLAKQAQFPVLFGEQVSSPDGLLWLDGVFTDLEAAHYSTGAHDLCAAGVSAPQARQRIFWVAYSECSRRDARTYEGVHREETSARSRDELPQRCSGSALRVAHTKQEQSERGESGGTQGTRVQCGPDASGRGSALWVGHADGAGPQRRQVQRHGRDERAPWAAGVGLRGDDGRVRRIEPGIFPLAHGVSDRVALIGGAGDAIVPLLAAEFIQASEEARAFELLGV